ncbi:uncharacterized protein LOC126836750 [Adelges cooleyi]|uniref:uncharacterized protein LOC126836750 n=1 Tax=Adelges cooleyi TaxID=133065 RepID=UPI00217F8A0A|nr:uncharacterized protein LOC126836750 [Adelges cooleyi]
MYFNYYLLFCVLNFFTAVRSIGLSKHQINSCVELFEKYKGSNNEIPRMRAIKYLLDLGYRKLSEIFPSKENVLNDRTVSEFLVFLADQDKTSDHWEEKGLTTYEVKLFVRMFDAHDKKSVHDGLLTNDELVNLFDKDLNLDRDAKEQIKNEFINDDSINVPKFLAAIVKHKPEGRGLDKTQIEKCFALYRSHLSHLITRAQNELLQTLHIVSDEYKNLLEFEHVRSAAKELQEFLVFWAEYNKGVDDNAPLLTSRQVREYIWKFTLHDQDKDGVLNFSEFNQLASTYFPGEDAELILETSYDPDNDYSMSAAMFLYMQLTIRSGHRRM